MNGLLCVAAIAASLVPTNLAITCLEARCVQVRDTHTICMYPNPNPAAACGRVLSVGFTQAEKMQIVNKHNELRQFVAAGKETRGKPGPQPAAAIMRIVSWDDELAELAQRWANQCKLGNDDCRDVGRFPVGQSYSMTMATGPLYTTPIDVLTTWYNEVEDLNRRMVKELTFNYNTSRYTQMVWGDTQKVGCGKIVYKSGGWNRYYMVCNYGPSGNFYGVPIYIAAH